MASHLNEDTLDTKQTKPALRDNEPTWTSLVCLAVATSLLAVILLCWHAAYLQVNIKGASLLLHSPPAGRGHLVLNATVNESSLYLVSTASVDLTCQVTSPAVEIESRHTWTLQGRVASRGDQDLVLEVEGSWGALTALIREAAVRTSRGQPDVLVEWLCITKSLHDVHLFGLQLSIFSSTYLSSGELSLAAAVQATVAESSLLRTGDYKEGAQTALGQDLQVHLG